MCACKAVLLLRLNTLLHIGKRSITLLSPYWLRDSVWLLAQLKFEEEKLSVGHQPGVLHVSDASSAKGVHAVSRQLSQEGFGTLGFSPWCCAPNAEVGVANRFGL